MLARLGQEAVGRDPAAHGRPLAREPALQATLGDGLDRDRIAGRAIGQMLEHERSPSGLADAWLTRRMAGGGGLAKGQTVLKDGRRKTDLAREQMAADVFLLIGNKKYSSWSLRPWLVLKQSGIDFDEQLVPLDQPDTTAKILAFSPSGRVPFLRHGKIEVWESLAISNIWPRPFRRRSSGPRTLPPAPMRAPSATRCMAASPSFAISCPWM